jgi:hypothetical protein
MESSCRLICLYTYSYGLFNDASAAQATLSNVKFINDWKDMKASALLFQILSTTNNLRTVDVLAGIRKTDLGNERQKRYGLSSVSRR